MQSARIAVSLTLLLLAGSSLAACSASSGSSTGASGSLVTVTSAEVASPPSSPPVASSAAPSPPSEPASAPASASSSSPPSTAPSASTSRSRVVTSSRSSTPAGSTTPPADCAQRTLDSLTRAQRIGQLMMVGMAADDLDDLTGSIPTVPVGGIFLSGKSTSSSADVLAGIQGIQKSVTGTSGVKAQIAVDQEGGYVQSLRGADFPAIPTAVQQGRLGTSDLRALTDDWARRLVQAGITLDLAPVADVVPAGTADQNPPIGGQDRQYGSTPDSVGESVTTVVEAMRAAHLGTTVKHFPGLGRVTANTDTSAAAVDDQTTADDPALQPFREAIAAGTTAVMISNARYPQLDPDQPAAFSKKIITGLLRNTMHFGGLVISDDLGSAVAVAATPAGQRAVDFITAGGDLVLTVQPADLAPMTTALTAAAAQNPAFRSRVDAAALHVLQSKESVGLLSCPTAG